jgi:16S rRNA (guanine1207-N2)-methyltransferase
MDIDQIKRDIVFQDQLAGFDFTFHSIWGLFSPRKIDDGTKALIDQLKIGEKDVCFDLGCGYGPLGLVMAKMAPKGVVHMVDKDFKAIEYATKNADVNQLGNTSVYLSNGFEQVTSSVKFDVIVSNIPAKVGKEMLLIILNDAMRHLVKGGKLYVVTVTGLKEFMKRNFKEVFGNYKKLAQSKGYVVGLAER